MVREWGVLEFAFHSNQTDRFRNIAGMGIDEADILIGSDILCHFGG